MRHRSKTPKPETGMELTVTLSMPADHNAEQSADAIVQFMEGVNRLTAETGAAWINIRCAGIPEEFEERIASALESLEPKRPRLELVINNAALPDNDRNTP